MWNYPWKYDLTLMVSAKKGTPQRKPAFTFLCEIYINVLLIPASAYKLSSTLKNNNKGNNMHNSCGAYLP